MRYLFGRRILNSNFHNNSEKVHIFAPRDSQLVCFATLFKPSNTPQNSNKRSKTGDLNDSREAQGFGSLFHEILGILGTESLAVDKSNTYELLISKEIQQNRSDVSVAEESGCSLHGGCGNADEKLDRVEMEKLSVFADEHELVDVSPTVHKVTEIIRGDQRSMVSMEERVGNAGFEYNEEIVEKVLKRCFKVPHLGLQFFKWLKLREGFRFTANICNQVLLLASEAKEFGLVEELVEGIEKSVYGKNVETWTVLMSHYGRVNMIGKALAVFEKMKKIGIEPDGITYRTMLLALCKGKESGIALEFYKEMVHKEVDIDVGLHKQLLKSLALSGDIAAVHLIGDNMITNSDIPQLRVYGLMLKSLCIAGRIREALELVQSMKNKNVSLDTNIFVMLVKGLCSTDRIVDALDIVEMMKKRNVFDRKIYEILISTYLRRNEVPKAFDLFQEMKDSGDVSVSTYTNLMQYLFGKNDFHKGIELYNEMIERGIQIDSLAITAVAAGYVRQNCISEAWKVFKSMDEKGIKATTKDYTIFIKELCKVSQTQEIVKVLDKMHADNVNIRENMFKRVLSYMEKIEGAETLEGMKLMHRACTIYHRDKAEQKGNLVTCLESSKKADVNQVEQPRLRSTLPESVSRSCGQDTREVCQILSSSTDWSFVQEKLEQCSFQIIPDFVAEVLSNCSLNGGNALKFFSWVGKKAGYFHNAQSYNMAMKIAGQGKDFKTMRSLFYEMKRRGCSLNSDTWTIIIMQYGRTGLTDIALRNFREMKLSGCKPTKSTYNSLMISLCGKKGRKVDEAIQIYQEMIRMGCIPDKEVIETYLCCLCEVNKLSDARSCVKSLVKCGFSVPLSYSFYFRALCRAGKLDDALALQGEVDAERNILDQYTYGSLIHCLLRKGLLKEALEKMRTMKHLDIHPTVHVYTSLIIYFFKEKDINRALETLEEMRKVGCNPTTITYSVVICGYIRMGQVTDAWNVFHHIKKNGPSPDFKMYSMIINCLCRTGKSEEAIKLIPEMMLNGMIPSTINFRTIFHGLNREGKPDLAQIVLKKKWDLKRQRKLDG
ncbi:pentatricopeptide repeat-containing protein mitochondrial [Dorcoceras hygrometricum]|uniref:Pentatricopeptide repeat-containing protein mitochondrial n=1 Tax=Dorcoceras hygrometricum TaxID=472368 RepID=A0A2Z7CP28_9LAMI|nr:pentatricopeptide repeat-containing protein mitochondrial [Dorcoceras hygrometricum]